MSNSFHEEELHDLREMEFFMVYNDVIDDEQLKNYDKLVYMAICRYANRGTRTCFPSLVTLSKKTGFSKPIVIRAINTLIERGYIQKQHRFSDKGKASNIYYINPLHVIRSKRDLPTVVNDIDLVNDVNQPSKQDLLTHVNGVDLNNTYFNQTNETRISPHPHVDSETLNNSSNNKVSKSEDKYSKKEEKNQYHEVVWMTEKQYTTLLDKYEKEYVLSMIETLNNYKQANKKKYDSDYHALLNWIRSDEKKGLAKKKTQPKPRQKSSMSLMDM